MTLSVVEQHALSGEGSAIGAAYHTLDRSVAVSPSLPKAPTIGEIARRLGVPHHRIEHLIQSRDLRPVARAGNARVFDEATVEYLRAELRRIDHERCKTGVNL